MKKTFIILIILLPILVWAVEEEHSTVNQMFTAAQLDSLIQAREQQVTTEYGFKTTQTLIDVADMLKIHGKGFDNWKSAMGLEPKNKNLDTMSLNKLGITPYRAYLAHQKALHGFDEQSSIKEISSTLSFPIKKLKTLLGLPNPLETSWDDYSLQALDISVERMQEIYQEFLLDSNRYGATITAVGMLVVFLALLITSLVISQLIYLNREKKAPEKAEVPHKQKEKANIPKEKLDRNAIIAAITALHLHKMEMEERRKMALTFRRTPTNQWRASAVLSMPNREMYQLRRNK